MRRTPMLLVALLVSACAPLALTASASASKPKIKVTNVSQGEILDDGKAEVTVKGKHGKATVQLRTGSSKLTKRRKVALNGKTKVRPKLTASGREVLSKCVERKLQATVTYRSKRGKKRTAKSAKRKAKLTWAPCSVGSEKPSKRPYFGPKIPTPHAERCDFLDTAVCMYPFPNDYFTVDDAATATGKRINFDAESMPKNIAETPIDPTPYNRADGYSPGEPLMIRIDGLGSQAAFDANRLVPVTDPGRYADANQRAVVINAATGERHPIFAELDATADGDVNRVLYLRPTVNFDERGHYIVALRGLRKANGKRIEPSLAFRSYRDRLITKKKPIEERRGHMEGLIGKLQDAGIKRTNLNVVWDFTVASERSIAGSALEIRDDAFVRLGDTNLSDLTVQGASPSFTVTDVRDCSVAGECDTDPVPELLRIVEGTIATPCYLNTDGCPPGSKFAYDDGVLTWNPSYSAEVPFTCVIPASAVNAGNADPARPSLYGHGLLGGRDEVERGSGGNIRTMANDHKMIFCATNWAGFSEDDLGQVVAALSDMSNFEAIADRMQQGFVNFMYLGRALIHPDGLGDNAAFQDGDGDSLIDDTRLFYDGNSQGGIMGGALTALAPDFNRAALGVPAMNYSTLLQRSVDFDQYAELPQIGLYDNYPDTLRRPLLFGVIQMLWDRGEANGYAHHMTSDPLADTPAHNVLMHLAYGDHQVANLAAEIEARTIGAPVMTPELDPGRHWAVDPLFDLTPIGSYPHSGSALVYWDGGPLGFGGTIGAGTAVPPNANVPPREIDGYGDDPHSYPRRDLQAQQQKSDFLQVNGALPGGCVGGDPCYSNGFTGAP